MHQFLLVLCGIPASGKTILAEHLADKLSTEIDVEIVSTDAWRDEEYYAEFLPENENIVRERALRKSEMLLSIGKSVIHDDTNYYTSMRHDLYDIAKMHEIAFGVLFINTPLEIAFEWNKDREFEIPREVVKRIHERLDRPGSKYAWDRPIASIDLSKLGKEQATGIVIDKIREMEPLVLEQPDAQQTYAELRDRITRQVVSKFLHENKAHRADDSVHATRKAVMKKANKEDLTVKETMDFLWSELSKISRRVS